MLNQILAERKEKNGDKFEFGLCQIFFEFEHGGRCEFD